MWSGNWGVELESQCAVRGTSVVIKCKYDYPFPHIVNSVSWYKAQPESGKWRLFIVSNQPSSPGHFTYAGNYRGDCTLQINNVQDADDGYYFFRFVTTLSSWTSKQPARLSVTGDKKTQHLITLKCSSVVYPLTLCLFLLFWIRVDQCCAAQYCDRGWLCQADLCDQLSCTGKHSVVQRRTTCKESSLWGQEGGWWQVPVRHRGTGDGQICLCGAECSMQVNQIYFPSQKAWFISQLNR